MVSNKKYFKRNKLTRCTYIFSNSCKFFVSPFIIEWAQEILLVWHFGSSLKACLDLKGGLPRVHQKRGVLQYKLLQINRGLRYLWKLYLELQYIIWNFQILTGSFCKQARRLSLPLRQSDKLILTFYTDWCWVSFSKLLEEIFSRPCCK